MSHPDQLPELFLDRSLGRLAVPNALRAAGLSLTTLAERYGVGHDQFVTDMEWLAEAGQSGEVVLMKDSRIYKNPAEWATVKRFGVRCFCLADRNISGALMAIWFLNNLDRITAACQALGPFMYIVNEHKIRLLPDKG